MYACFWDEKGVERKHGVKGGVGFCLGVVLCCYFCRFSICLRGAELVWTNWRGWDYRVILILNADAGRETTQVVLCVFKAWN